jgi:hypothetical protein
MCCWSSGKCIFEDDDITIILLSGILKEYYLQKSILIQFLNDYLILNVYV